MLLTEELFCPDTGDRPCCIGPLPDRSMLGIIEWMIKKKPLLLREFMDSVVSHENIFKTLNRMNRELKFSSGES